MIRFHLHGYGEFNATQRIGPSVWPHFDLLFIHDGHVTIRLLQRDNVELRSGESILIFPGTSFAGYSLVESSRASVMHFSIEGRPADLRPPFARLVRLRRGFELNDETAGKRIEPDIHRAMKLTIMEPSPLLQELRVAVLTLILAELSGQTRTPDGMDGGGAFESVIAWALENLSERLAVSDLARRSGLSPSHFRCRFRREVGRSAGAFLKDLRLREASRLLRETRMPIKQITRQSGYTDVATLYHAFRKRNGITPVEYRVKFAPRG